MNNGLENKNRLKEKNGLFSQNKSVKKVFLSLHVMPHKQEPRDVRVFSWLTASLLILASLIIFVMMYV